MKRSLTIGLVTASLVLGLGGLVVTQSSSAAPASPRATPPITNAQAAIGLKQKQMADAARNAFEDALARYAAGSAPLEEVATWSRRTYESDPDRGTPAAATAFGDRGRRLEKEVLRRFAAGTAAKSDTLAATYFRAEAEAAEAGARTIAVSSGDSQDPLATYR